eukprot:CAMPEP_0172554692 /NCGR_PEP_ID=MMETSP1067-20121228/55949_1 /TAXON_ID=265564 ORGANISM="Thalassiosira punctigera, Strain Tpunct2005C2" /NCGR_SAMPLE_ID=MMETSP1067 /ASSEMBLY_ACC=CAM_ASM_000444 /LENGTH=443 /DNA_ID=CAMNT_0013343115 /DNA_START=47 /DNA_END=1375 /DNA_ORIENTATION=-
MVEIETDRTQGLQFSQRRTPARLLSDVDSGDIAPPKTLVVYSGPTSMDRLQEKNGMYIDNMNYFLTYGISCFDIAPGSKSGSKDDTEYVIVNYAFVLTQDVADYYTAPDGPITKKIQECERIEKKARGSGESTPFIKVMTRQDRCYDMESIRTVVTKMNVQALYDNLLFINCGMVGPKFGSGTPALVPSTSTNKPNAKQKMVPYSHWSQLYTSRLTDSVRLVGHSINTHFHTFFPHVQSFLYATKTETMSILVSSGAIYDCGLTQEELGSNDEKRFELINRYEVGMSTQLLKRGYKIATAFVNRYEFGKSLVYNKDSIWGTEIDDTVSDIWCEDGIRNLTATMSRPTPKWWKLVGRSGLRNPDEDTFEYHQYDILPWDRFLFFKVSRLVPEDVQNEMNYDLNELERNNVLVISNDPRKSRSEYWLRKTGVFVEPRNLLLDAVW